MGISIHRINNYMIVATLILSVAAGALLSVSFSPDCPGFIVFAFYLCTGISLMFLMESIMFGVKGQNSAFTNTMKLLTYQVRIDLPFLMGNGMPYPIPKNLESEGWENGTFWGQMMQNDMMLETYGEVGMYIGLKTWLNRHGKMHDDERE